MGARNVKKKMSDYEFEMIQWMSENITILHLLTIEDIDSIRPEYALEVIEKMG